MKKLNAIALISAALVANLAFAQIAAKKPATSHTATAPAKANATRPASAAASGTALPTNVEVDAYMKRSFGYDPGISWQIVSIRESVVPGIAEIIVSINRGEPNHLYFSAGSQVALLDSCCRSALTRMLSLVRL